MTHSTFPRWLVTLALCSNAPLSSAVNPEYISRLAALPPRDAAAYAALGAWAKAQGLEEEAAKCLERAIAIDPDCEEARIALGYRRHGTGWRKEGERKPISRRSSPRGLLPPLGPLSRTSGIAPAGSPGATDPSDPTEGTETVAPTALPSVPAPEPLEPAATPFDPKPTRPRETAAAQAATVAIEVERKKTWARDAATKIAATFSTYEDNDFLVHSSLPASSREVKVLVNHLKGLKKHLAGIVGGGGSAKYWPDKLQFVLLKSEPEYERFASMVDGLASAKNPTGAYTSGDHTVLHNPESDALARVLGETALKKMNGSDRWIGWWLSEGIAEMLHAQSPSGLMQGHYATSIKFAAEVMKAEAENLKIFNVIETASYRERDSTKNRALALSLVDFLLSSKGAFQGFIKTLKSESAPAPPVIPENSKSREEFDAFHLSFISFQESALEASFRMQISTMAERWKLYTQKTAESLRSQETGKERKDEAARNRKRKGN
ncbi:MAG TPA: hypothetical protein VMT52_13990 [Planctomycetota bacterium]|nr:hypothetical protein [Planctomycetota bacterium]